MRINEIKIENYLGITLFGKYNVSLRIFINQQYSYETGGTRRGFQRFVNFII